MLFKWPQEILFLLSHMHVLSLKQIYWYYLKCGGFAHQNKPGRTVTNYPPHFFFLFYYLPLANILITTLTWPHLVYRLPFSSLANLALIHQTLRVCPSSSIHSIKFAQWTIHLDGFEISRLFVAGHIKESASSPTVGGNAGYEEWAENIVTRRT